MQRHPSDRRELKRQKKKQDRYNRVIAVVMACKHNNAEMLAYILGSE